jgi:hypothetical protein
LRGMRRLMTNRSMGRSTHRDVVAPQMACWLLR